LGGDDIDAPQTQLRRYGVIDMYVQIQTDGHVGSL
jgi:hypothetical protein